MAAVEKIRITKESNGITVRLRPKKSWLALCYLPIFLTAWTFGGIGVVKESLKGDERDYPIVLLWLVFWLVAEFLLIFAFLWNILGEEIVSIRGGVFTHKLAVWGFGSKKIFPADELFNIRPAGFSDDSSTYVDNRHWRKLGFADRAVVVDTKYATLYGFGIRLEESEAAALAKALEPYLPPVTYLMPVPTPDMR